MNVYGELTSAQLENLAADPTLSAVRAGRMWWRTDISSMKVDFGGTTDTVATLAATQSFSNKTFSDSVNLSQAPTMAQVATPSAPSAGKNKLYFKSDNNLYALNSGSVESLIGGPTQAVPAGAVMPFAGTTAPTGYLLCDGSAVSRTTYANLFSAIGVAHGSGDGSTTFNLPDYRGRFLRGVDSTAGRDPDKASRSAMASGGNTGNNVGSIQSNATAKNGLALTDPSHSHSEQTVSSLTGGVLSWPNVANTTSANNPTPTGGVSTASASTGITLGNGDNETRPVNAYVNFIIKT